MAYRYRNKKSLIQSETEQGKYYSIVIILIELLMMILYGVFSEYSDEIKP